MRLFKKTLFQNEVIERIIEPYWYSYIKSKSRWHVLEVSGTICIATNNYCQVLINFVNQNLGKSSTSSDMSGGRGKYCCAPECGSARYNKFGNKTLIGFFKFPSKEKKPQKYQSWVKTISMYRRRGGGDTFDPSSKNAVICEYHFKEEHLEKAAESTRKVYTEDAVPSISKFKSLT